MKKNLFYTFIIFLGIMLFPFSIKAAPVGLNFSVAPSEEQYTAKGYFDFQTQANQVTNLTVNLTNTSSKKITVHIEKLNALTDSNGNITYVSKKAVKDSKLLDQTRLAKKYLKGPNQVILAAKESKKVTFTYHAPKNIHDGQVVGGLNFYENSGNSSDNYSSSDKSFKITNRVTRMIAIVANYQPLQAKLTVGKAFLTSDSANPLINIKMKNTVAQMGHDLRFSYTLKNNDGKTLYHQKFTAAKTGTPFAPVSSWVQQINWPLKTYREGTYHLTLHVKTASPAQSVTKNYTLKVKNKDVSAFQKASGTKNVAKTNWGLIIAVIVLAILVIALIITNIRMYQKNRKS
ncbi:DUF916 and DUF3324 domain-containing protein [Ligilactobacillus equi]|uniref:WxL protein peptidoglycan domain-containing protein n=1 Tax=Ligilactobacillus equi TaxID=137357 RepID=UPI002ED17C3E